jgi:hypothetical protein
MARSRRKTPKTKITGIHTSDKKDRSLANRKFRRQSKVDLEASQEPPVSLREVSDTWGFESDGLARWNDTDNRRK